MSGHRKKLALADDEVDCAIGVMDFEETMADLEVRKEVRDSRERTARDSGASCVQVAPQLAELFRGVVIPGLRGRAGAASTASSSRVGAASGGGPTEGGVDAACVRLERLAGDLEGVGRRRAGGRGGNGIAGAGGATRSGVEPEFGD